MISRSKEPKVIALDPRAFGTSILFPYTVDIPMPRGVKPPRDSLPSAETAKPAEESQADPAT